jgi:hypothetical protein
MLEACGHFGLTFRERNLFQPSTQIMSPDFEDFGDLQVLNTHISKLEAVFKYPKVVTYLYPSSQLTWLLRN